MIPLVYQFDRATLHYNEAAEPQRLVTDRLVQLIKEHLPRAERHFAHALETGTGSGLLTERIDQLLEVDHWTLSDLSPVLLTQVPRLGDLYSEMRAGDVSELSLEGSGTDLFVSSSAIQWLSDPCAYLQCIVHEPSGEATIAISTFSPDNLLEIRQLTGQGLRYPSLATWHCTLQELGYPHEIHTERLVIPFADPLAVLQHPHHTGTAQLLNMPQQIRTPNQFRRFTKEYITTFADKTG